MTKTDTQYELHHHKLKDVKFVETPNQRGLLKPKGLVYHFTASENFNGTIDWLCNRRAKASAHLVIDTDGTVVQLAPFNKKTWHAGRSKWKSMRGMNSYTIGFEFMNPGMLKIVGEGVYKSWYGKIFTKDDHPEIIEERHQNGGPVAGWIPFTEAQNRVAVELGSFLMDKYGLEFVVGHDMIAPHRKNDPGPCLDENVYNILHGRQDDEDSFYVIKNTNPAGLNLRDGPGVSHKKIVSLPDNTVVELHKKRGSWGYVEVKHRPDLEGWVHCHWLHKVVT